MVLREKLYKKYNRYTDIGEIIGFSILDRLNQGKLPALHLLFNKIDLEIEIGYTYEDVLIDYKDILEKFQEKKAVYNIWKMGYSINGYSKVSGTGSQLHKILTKGEHIMQKETRIKLADIFEYSVDIEDLKSFEVICKPKFCKLIGEKDDLFYFKEKYDLDYPVLPYYNTWHLAFDGVIAEKIREVVN